MTYIAAMPVERVSYVFAGERRILLLDLADAGAKEIADVIAKARPLIRGAEKNSVFTLTVVTNVTVTAVHQSELIEFVKDNKPYVRAAAVTGVGDLARAVLATTRILTGRQLRAFDSQQEALIWLGSVP